MFLSLGYDAEFPPSLIHPQGRTLKQTFNLQKGLTAITGQNEIGKSFSLEMIRFGLWGSAALRSSGDSYKSIEMFLVWLTRGDAYRVERTLKKAVLKRGAEVIATGVTAVNEKIVKLMGFGIDVFDVACFAKQNDLLNLTRMKPTERKRLIDSVVGIGALEVVGKWAGQEATLHERDAKTVRMTLTEPTVPARPEVSEELPVLLIKQTDLETAAAELAGINGWLSVSKQKPEQPECKVNLPVENLRQFADQRRDARLKVEALRARVRALPESVGMTREQIPPVRAAIEAYEAYVAAQARLNRNVKPTASLVDAQAKLETWAKHQKMLRVQGINADLRGDIVALSNNKSHCPACHHEWEMNQTKIDELRARIMVVDEVTPPEDRIPDLNKVVKAWEVFDQTAFDTDSAVPFAMNPGLTMRQLEVVEATISMVEERVVVAAELAALEPKLNGPDYEVMLAQRQAYEHGLKVYQNQLSAYHEWTKERAGKLVRAETLQRSITELPKVKTDVQALQQWQRDYDRYGREMLAYEAKLSDAQELDRKAGQYRLVQEAMARLRSRIKGFLLPSLNRVSSLLLSRLTGGARTSVVIDEEFNILVDGQKVDTLSGSGEACANLAIRIALGQVLVNGVLSVFMGDEIDSSMDKFRVGETALTLRNLVNSVSQIIIVSHKDFEADHTVELGVLNGQDASP